MQGRAWRLEDGQLGEFERIVTLNTYANKLKIERVVFITPRNDRGKARKNLTYGIEIKDVAP